MSRAGLSISFLLCFLAFTGFVASSPVPERLSHLVYRAKEDWVNKLLARSFEILFADRELDSANLGYTKVSLSGKYNLANGGLKREFDDFPVLEKRDFDGVEYRKTKNDELTTHKLQRRNVFSKFKNSFKHAFSKVKQGIQKATQKIKQAGKTVGKGFQKVGHYLKENGAKIGKFGLKILAAAASAAGRVVKFIPGIGTAVSMGLKGIAMGANIASDKIHAHLGGALGRVAGGLDYIISPVGIASKKLGGAGIAANLFGREEYIKLFSSSG